MSRNKKFFIKTYGCQMNSYDSDRIAEILLLAGHIKTSLPEDADIVVINTCNVREKAQEKLFSDLGRIALIKAKAAEKGRSVIILVVGCVAQALGKEIFARADCVDIVLGPQAYQNIQKSIEEVISQKQCPEVKMQKNFIVDTTMSAEDKFKLLPRNRTLVKLPSAFISIQEGCDKFCTYCSVPYTRGREYSRPTSEIISEANQLVSSGAREIFLLGQNVSAYNGKYSSSAVCSFTELLFLISSIKGVERIRYTTSHPCDITTELMKAHKEISSLMPFIHLPAQSGSDIILKKMNRGYSRSQYIKIINEFRKILPNIAFSSDFIVGFPGETETDFEATCALVDEVSYAQAYSFKYSPRPQTPSSKWDQIDEQTKIRRLAVLQEIINKHQLHYNQSMEGKELLVLIEKEGRYENQVIGKTEYMQSVHLSAPKNFIGKVFPVKISRGFQNSLSGKLVG
nr:tRNA (N6-isopentenyl adenosine(37)-C2)-methylthiotransferase MiaB [Candidatus Hydrogenosomobacter endosymbioticus]